MANPLLPKVSSMGATASDHHPLEADMPRNLDHLAPPVDESADDLEWKYGFVALVDQLRWNSEWADIRAKALERRRQRRME